MTDEHPPGPDYPLRGKPRPELLALGFHTAADVIHRLLDHISEMDTADLPLPGGRSVRIVTVTEVEEWLLGCETRVRNGAIL